MSISTVRANVADLIDSYAEAPADQKEVRFSQLLAAVWDEGKLTDLSAAAVPVLIERLGRIGDDRKGALAIILGLLAEAESPGAGKVGSAVREGLDGYLDLWRAALAGTPLSLALQYLVAHFPDDRDRILATATTIDLDRDDFSRLDRALQHLDPERPVLGRVFPSPSVWELEDAERQFDDAWIGSLSPEQVVANWNRDTRTVLGHAGAKGYWAVCNEQAPVPWHSDSIPPRHALPAGSDAGLFAPHADALRCPHCAGPLEFRPHGVVCARCASTYPIAGGILDLTARAGADGDARASDFQFKLAEMPSMGFFYEAYARPNFLRLSGSNWDGAVTPADEDDYIAAHVHPVDGPVLDLAAGAGRWTESLVRAVGADRVIALDLNLPMLMALRGRLPETPALLASGSALPFDDASLGAVLCWNALQAFPQDARATIEEVGRCLRPGGTFTLMTFRNSADPVYRYFVASHTFPQHEKGLRLFELEDLRTWLRSAGLTIRDEAGPGTFVFITAERPL